MRKFEFALMVICVLPLEEGCTLIATSDQSVFSSGEQRNTITLDSVTIRIIPQNYRVLGFIGPVLPVIPFWHSQVKNRFWIVMSLSSITGELQFDPKKVALHSAEGTDFVPVGYNGPWNLQDLKTPEEALVDESTLDTSLASFPIPTEEVFVGLMFDTRTPDPDQLFTLSLNSFEGPGAAIAVTPPLAFRRERKRLFHFSIVYPLTISKQWVVE